MRLMRHKGRFHTPPRRSVETFSGAVRWRGARGERGGALVAKDVAVPAWRARSALLRGSSESIWFCWQGSSRFLSCHAVALECVALQGAECVQGVPP